jgi:hypothetical protein
MNAKKVKYLRQALRHGGVAVGNTQYRRFPSGTIKLDQTCGRAIYQKCKKTAIQGRRRAHG